MSEAAAATTHAAVHETGHDAWEAALTRFQRPALLIGAVGLVLTLVGFLVSTDSALRSYLWAFCYWTAIPIGSLAFLMIQHMTGGTWGLVLRRLLEAAAWLMVLAAVLSVPLLIAVALKRHTLYPWIEGQGFAGQFGHAVNPEHLWFKKLWLSPGPFIFRTLVYFGIWAGLALFLYGWSGREDRTGNNPEFAFRARQVAAPGILLLGLAVTFAFIDWVMSLDPSWYSTMFGVLYLVGSGLETLAFMIVVLGLLSHLRPMRDVITPGVLNDVGNLMFAFTLLWAYTNFSQFLIQWSGNIAEETPYYYVRTHGSWGAMALFIVLFHFFTPFFLLLWRRIKRNIRPLMMVAFGILIVRSVDLFWMIKPMFIQREITLGPLTHGPDTDPSHGGQATPQAKGTAEAHMQGTGEPQSTSAQNPGGLATGVGDDHKKADPAAAGDPMHRENKTGTHGATATVHGEHHVPVKGIFEGGAHWTDIPAIAGIGGLFVFAFIWKLKQRPLLPPNDPRLAALAHGGHH